MSDIMYLIATGQDPADDAPEQHDQALDQRDRDDERGGTLFAVPARRLRAVPSSEAFARASLSLCLPVGAPPVLSSLRAGGSEGHADRQAENLTDQGIASEPRHGEGSPPCTVAPSSVESPDRVRRTYRREVADELASRATLYGDRTRSGNVTHLGAQRIDLRVVHSDVPFGMTLAAWRKTTKNAVPGSSPDAA